MDELLRPRGTLPLLLLLLLLASIGCAGRAAPPSPDDSTSRPPDLQGATVMVLPSQTADASAVAGLDREIAYWLGERGTRVKWIFAPALRDALARSPALGIQLDALAVNAFTRGEVKNIGDPLFGDLHSLAVLTNAQVALVPVRAAFVSDGAGGGRIEIGVALIETTGGRVLWFGVVAGSPGELGSQAAAASAAQALARRIVG
jgi:hypothetical protein